MRKYYRLKKDIFSPKTRKDFIENELLTETEFLKSGLSLRPVEIVYISQKETYKNFGVRFKNHERN